MLSTADEMDCFWQEDSSGYSRVAAGSHHHQTAKQSCRISVIKINPQRPNDEQNGLNRDSKEPFYFISTVYKY